MNPEVFDVNLVAGAMIPALLLGTARYVFQLWGHDGELPRSVVELLQRYVWGTASILLGDVVWLSLVARPLSSAEVITGLVTITASGGLVVVLRYASDWASGKLRQEPLHQQISEALERERE